MKLFPFLSRKLLKTLFYRAVMICVRNNDIRIISCPLLVFHCIRISTLKHMLFDQIHFVGQNS